jgi:hypothetical protein
VLEQRRRPLPDGTYHAHRSRPPSTPDKFTLLSFSSAIQAISALNRFAEVAANRPERFGTAFLTELLTLHVGKSIALTKIDTKTRLGEVSRGLVVQQRS